MKAVSGIFVLLALCSSCIFLTKDKTLTDHTAASAALADVEAAVSGADSGDTVIVPAGAATWANPLVISKGINLIGAGAGSTIITSNYANAGDYLISYRPDNPELNEAFRLSGFTLNCNNRSGAIALINLTTSPIRKIRIDNNTVNDPPGRGIFVAGTVYGVIDSNTLNCPGYAITSYGNNEATWNALTVNFGTADNMYIEDNTFIVSDGVHASGGGGGYVARYNTYTSTGNLTPWCDMHGNMGSGMNLSTMCAEIYGNTIRAGDKVVVLADHRGGKALIYDNTVMTTGAVGLQVREEYNDNLNPPAVSPISGQPQYISDSYYWNNTKGTSLIPLIIGQLDYGGSIGLVPQANRDYWFQGSSFNGTSGVGVGPLSTRPTTCTKGVGYWATDTKTLYKATATDVWTAYYMPFTYPHPLRSHDGGAAITTTSPNGGESWIAGPAHSVTWMTTGTIGNVKIDYSTDGGASYASIIASTPNTGSYAWTVPNTPSTNCLVRVSQASTGTPIDTSNAVFAIISPVSTTITLNRSRLTFAATTGGNKTSPQTVLIENDGTGNLNWSAEGIGSPNFLQVTPTQGTGNGIIQVGINTAELLPGTYFGSLTVSDSNALNSPQTIDITLRIYDQGKTTSPFGTIDTPLEGSTVRSFISVSGWALDDIGVASVRIYRDPIPGEEGGAYGLVYVGDSTFIDGARNDVPSLYPDHPQNYKAGWGYMMLTNFLPPDQGNGVYRLHAIATDREGNIVELGTKTIICDNAHTMKPFGNIDSPEQGGGASGPAFANLGWALTPMPNFIPMDGSSIWVWVDGVALGHPVYNNYRADIAVKFPGYANANGAIGVYELETTKYSNGVHIISWSVRDSAGNEDGIGSRFFNVLNTGATQSPPGSPMINAGSPQVNEAIMNRPGDLHAVTIRKGFKRDSLPMIVEPDRSGTIRIEIGEMDLLKIDLGKSNSVKGWIVARNEPLPLPIGSTLDSSQGTYSWMPGPGFLGEYDFVFLKKDPSVETRQILIKVVIKPRFGKE